MKFLILSFSLCVLFFSQHSYSQGWTQNLENELVTVVNAYDGGFLCSSYWPPYELMKLDDKGNIQYGKYYSDEMWMDDLISAGDGNYVFTGTGRSDQSKLYVYKVNSRLDTLWKKVISANYTSQNIVKSFIKNYNGLFLAYNVEDQTGAWMYSYFQSIDNPGFKINATGRILEVGQASFGGFNLFTLEKDSVFLTSYDNTANVVQRHKVAPGQKYFTNVKEFTDEFYLFNRGSALTAFNSTADTLFHIKEQVYAMDKQGEDLYMFCAPKKIVKYTGTKKIWETNLPSYAKQMSGEEKILLTPDHTVFASCTLGLYMPNYLRTQIFKIEADGKFLRNQITGKVFNDYNKNCKYDQGEAPLPYVLVHANPSGYYTMTDTNGVYHLAADTGTIRISGVPSGENWAAVCGSDSGTAYKFSGADSVISADIPMQFFPCPHLKVDLNAARYRPCIKTKHTIDYENAGTALAVNTSLHVYLPEPLIFLSASHPVVKQGNELVFDLGNLPAGYKGQISISDSISCSTQVLTEICVKAFALPDTSCVPPSDLWDRSDVEVSSLCNMGTLNFTIHNKGIGDMTDSSTYRIYHQFDLIQEKKFKLKKDEKLALQLPSEGSYYRIEADQRPHYPVESYPRSSVLCNGNTDEMSIYDSQIRQDDGSDAVEVSCGVIVNSYDPNEKTAVPGISNGATYIKPGAELEYVIHFQNVGSGDALSVQVVDTLSENLNINTLKIGSMSHPGKVEIYGKKNNVLKWSFDNIQLSPLRISEQESQGWVKYTIHAQETLAEGTVIYNNASIVFDYNSPIHTNTTVHLIGKEELVTGTYASSESTTYQAYVAPNPFTQQVRFTFPSAGPYMIQITDVTGRIVKLFRTNLNALEADLSGLEKGIYIYHIYSETLGNMSGKLMKE